MSSGFAALAKVISRSAFARPHTLLLFESATVRGLRGDSSHMSASKFQVKVRTKACCCQSEFRVQEGFDAWQVLFCGQGFDKAFHYTKESLAKQHATDIEVRFGISADEP